MFAVKLSVPIWDDKWRLHSYKLWLMKNNSLTSGLTSGFIIGAPKQWNMYFIIILISVQKHVFFASCNYCVVAERSLKKVFDSHQYL